jgi:hypothetical protein
MMAEHMPKHVANNSVNMLKEHPVEFPSVDALCFVYKQKGVSGLVLLLYSFYWSQGSLGFIQKQMAPQQTAAVQIILLSHLVRRSQ